MSQTEYEQVKTALQQGHATTPRATGPPQEGEYLEVVRRLAIEAVYGTWNQHSREASLQDIYQHVRGRLEYRSQNSPYGWRLHWQLPSKRTVDRRVNEAADPRVYPGMTPLVCVRIGYYLPSPRAFDGETRIRLERLFREKGDY